MGAKALNQLVLESLNELTKSFFVFHIVGKGNLSNIKNPNYLEIEFTDMSLAYAMSDLVVSRAGSNTAFELATLKIPTLFIPLPKSVSRGDQIENAEYFKRKKYAEVLREENMNIHSLSSKLQYITKNKEQIIPNMKKANVKNANQKIVEIIIKNTKT